MSELMIRSILRCLQDKASDGLLLLTTDHSLCAQMLRPGRAGSRISKEYHIATQHRMSDESLQLMRTGLKITNRSKTITTLPCVVERICEGGVHGDDKERSTRHLQIILKV
jgi:16S rRNA U516 pseudouridylate synthase RsuA-like enzyme